MNRIEYNACIADRLRGKKFSKEERGLEFCVTAKLCSGKVSSREEALQICSLPKEPKEKKVKKDGKPESCKKDSLELARCMVKDIDMKLISDAKLLEQALARSLIECQCSGK